MTQLLNEKTDTDRETIVKLIRKWADVNTDGLLEPTVKTFFVEGIEGFIGYRIEGSHAVVFGDPVCSAIDKPTLALAFQKHCESQKLGVVYTIVSKDFADWSFKALDACTVEFGEVFILDPFQNPVNNKGSHAVLVRKKVKHATKDGVIIQEYTGHDPAIEQEINSIATSWVGRRRGPQIYLAHITLFNDRIGKRWFYAQHKGKIVGLIVLNELKAKSGWLLNNQMLTQEAPNGTSELMIISALETLAKEDCHYVEAGPVTRKELGEINGMNKAFEKVTRLIFKGAKHVFHLEGYEAFWTKFDPKIEGCYLSFPKKNMGYSSIRALMAAYNMSMSP